jgi:hypothetical protein
MGKRKLRLEDVRNMEEDMLTPAIVADVIGCSGFTLGTMAHEEPEKLPFPCICIGRNTYFPRSGFINWADGMTKNDFWKDRYFDD